MISILKQIEDLLEKVSVQGEENWRRMAMAKEGLRSLRTQIKKVAEEQKKKEDDHGAGEDAIRHGEQENGAGTV